MKRKAFIITDLIVASIILSALASIYMSTALMTHESTKIDFIAQKKTYFDSLTKRAEEECKELYDPEETVYLYDYEKKIKDYGFYYFATCKKSDKAPDIYIVDYRECVYPTDSETGFVDYSEDENYSSRYCNEGIRYVQI